ncbi:hypothetical protein GCM10011494_15090 [Novosphingobium endophyticum]|uniref:Transporter n=1 Tax=Novosphingobium endophyticum TaxID=1955250 RepID=A0A916X5I4_9SPHN|nr:hypothetical protein [Novosphingobium endophyticum]GGB97587.1 hypothetical protein GCM10011494_15090 [Novosphingobium endophyticum]
MRRFIPGIVIAFGTTAASVVAQDTQMPESADRPSSDPSIEEGEARKDRITTAVGAAVVSTYISRGISFSEEPSLQAYVTVTVDVPELTGGAVTRVQVFVGNWNSIKLGPVEPTETGQLTRFYENDLYAGARLELGQRWTVSATYYRYESLSEAFEGYNDLELIVGFDDTGIWAGAIPLDAFSLSPSLRMVQEAGRPGRPDALYTQPSLSPSFNLGDPERPVRVSVPLVLGISDEYYDDVRGGHETVGFFRTGITIAGQPFADRIPALSVDGGVDVWFLNDRVANGLGNSELTGRVGIVWSF